MIDQLGFGHACDHGEHVERRPPPEYRGSVNDSTLVARQPVQLPAHDLRKRERKRLCGQRVWLRVPRRAQDLLEEKRIATGPRVQRVGCLRRQRASVHARQERRHVGMREAVEPQVVHRPPPIEANEEISRGKETSELIGPVRTQQHRAVRRAGREPLEHPETLSVGPVQVLEDDHRGSSRDAGHERVDDRAELVRAVRNRVDAEGVERELERTAERSGLGLAGERRHTVGKGRAELAQEPRLAYSSLADHERDRGV